MHGSIIFDIDGTLANVNDRLHHIQKEHPDWDSFFNEVVYDDVIVPVMILLNNVYAAGHNEVLLVSARPEKTRKDTLEWLEYHGIKFHKLYMRKDDDRRPDTFVKKEILEQIINDGYYPMLAIDDRAEVVDMWRTAGIQCLQCDSDFSKHQHTGKVLLRVMVGPSGAGKSTYCEKNYPSGWIVSTDKIREENGWGHAPEDVAKTFDYAHGLIRLRLMQGLDTVFDATNVKKSARDRVMAFVPAGQLVEYVVIDRDYDEKVSHKGNRTEDLVKRHHNIMQSELSNIMNGDGRPNVIVIDRRIK